MIKRTATLTTTGGAGAATGNTTIAVPASAYLVDIALDYHASAPATTDLTFTGSVAGLFLTLANQKTDRNVKPRAPVQDNAGANIVGAFDKILFERDEVITIAAVESDALAPMVSITMRFEEVPGRKGSIS